MYAAVAIVSAFAGTRQGGKVHVFSLFKEEVIVPMFDLHFRQIQVQGFWLTQASSSRHHTAIFFTGNPDDSRQFFISKIVSKDLVIEFQVSSSISLPSGFYNQQWLLQSAASLCVAGLNLHV